MAIYHFGAKKITRGKGRSAIACAAYRSGTKLFDQETQQFHDYTRKGGVKFSAIVLPENAPAEYADRETLWNAVQDVETRSTARLALEFELALPHELPFEIQVDCLMEFANRRAAEGMIVDVNHHQRHKKKTADEEEKRNDHGHLMATTRKLDANGKWLSKGKKEYARDENGNKIPLIDPKTGLQKVRVRPGKGVEKLWKQVTVEINEWNNKENMELWRADWAEILNCALKEIGSPVRVDHRSYKDQGIDKIPTIHEGYAAREIEARGGKSELCEYNRKVREANGTCITYDLQYAELEAEKKTIEVEIAAEKARIEVEETARIEAEEAARKATEAQAAAAKGNTKQRLTPEQYRIINAYFKYKEAYWIDYVRAKELADEELRAVYKDPAVRAAYGRLKQAQYMVEHSTGFLDFGLNKILLMLAQKDYEHEEERVNAAKERVKKLRDLSKQTASLNAVQRNLRETNQITDDLARDILAQQEAINKQLKEIDGDLYGRGQQDQEIIVATVNQDAQAMLDLIKEERLRKAVEAEEAARKAAEKQAAADRARKDSERRRQTYGPLIQAQTTWIQLVPAAQKEPYTDKYEKEAAALKGAITAVERARAAELSAADALRHAGLFGKKKAKRNELEKAREDLREALAGLAKHGVSGIQMTDEPVTDTAYNQAIQAAKMLLDQTEARAERERAKLKKEPLEVKNKRAEAERQFKEICRTVPAGQRDEAIRTLREAAGKVDRTTESKLESFYAEIPIGSTWERRERSEHYDGQAGDGGEL